MDKGLAERLLASDNQTLALVVNRWKGFNPTMVEIDALTGKTTELPVPEGFMGLYEAWSSPENAERFLQDLGVSKTGVGENSNRSDGECDLLFLHRPSGRRFRLNNNYYVNTCYVAAARWALSMHLGLFEGWSPDDINVEKEFVPGASVLWRNPLECGSNEWLMRKLQKEYPGELKIIRHSSPPENSKDPFTLVVSHNGTVIGGNFSPYWFIPSAH